MTSVLDRILTFLESIATGHVYDDQSDVIDIRRYCVELRLVITRGASLGVSRVGNVMRMLRGRDAVVWLLELEALQSMGRMDDWRLSRDLADDVARADMWQPRPRTASQETLLRLELLGVVSYQPDGLIKDIGNTGREILREIADPSDTPVRLLARALLQDETNETLVATHDGLASALADSVAASSVRQTRMVAHEVRNALIPVQIALDALFAEIAKEEPTLERYRSRINAGMDRVFRFIDDTIKTASLITELPSAFDLIAAVRDAVGAIQTETDCEVELLPGPELPPIDGSRQRFVLAILNMLRNAAQAVEDRPEIRVQYWIDGDGQLITILIDDKGPGVPPEFREKVFSPGFSLRPGGSGHGLAFARDVVEKELRGTMGCEDSPVGGARFRITIPVRRGTP
jgi:signal transduction histidine kinase